MAAKLLPDDSYQQGGARAAPMTGERIEAGQVPEMTQTGSASSALCIPSGRMSETRSDVTRK